MIDYQAGACSVPGLQMSYIFLSSYLLFCMWLATARSSEALPMGFLVRFLFDIQNRIRIGDGRWGSFYLVGSLVAPASAAAAASASVPRLRVGAARLRNLVPLAIALAPLRLGLPVPRLAEMLGHGFLHFVALAAPVRRVGNHIFDWLDCVVIECHAHDGADVAGATGLPVETHVAEAVSVS